MKDNGTKKDRISTVQKKRVFLQSLEKNLGVITPAMKEAKIGSRATIKLWRENDKRFAEQMEEIQSVAGDFVENALLKSIKEGRETSIIFYCKTKLKNRGYIERSEVTGADGKDIIPHLQIEIIDKQEQVDKTDENTNL